MNQMEGFKLNARENLVYKLNMRLYRMKHKTDHWCNNFDSFKLEHGFKILEANLYVFITRYEQEKHIVVFLYMKDMLIVGHDKNVINRFRKDLGNQFVTKDLGPKQQLLALRVICDKKKKILSL